MKLIARIILSIFISILLTACGGSNFMLDRGKQSYEVQNYRQAFIRLKPVANSGNPKAQYALAYMYYYGQGVVENRPLAIKWMKQAADQGDIDAIKALAIIRKIPNSQYQPSTNPKKIPL